MNAKQIKQLVTTKPSAVDRAGQAIDSWINDGGWHAAENEYRDRYRGCTVCPRCGSRAIHLESCAECDWSLEEAARDHAAQASDTIYHIVLNQPSESR